MINKLFILTLAELCILHADGLANIGMGDLVPLLVLGAEREVELLALELWDGAAIAGEAADGTGGCG